MKTIGLSPKLFPAVIAIVVGLVLYLLGEQTTGLAVLLTGVGALGLGVASPPGVVAMAVGEASDDLLPDEPKPLPEAASHTTRKPTKKTAAAKKKPPTRKKA